MSEELTKAIISSVFTVNKLLTLFFEVWAFLLELRLEDLRLTLKMWACLQWLFVHGHRSFRGATENMKTKDFQLNVISHWHCNFLSTHKEFFLILSSIYSVVGDYRSGNYLFCIYSYNSAVFFCDCSQGVIVLFVTEKYFTNKLIYCDRQPPWNIVLLFNENKHSSDLWPPPGVHHMVRHFWNFIDFSFQYTLTAIYTNSHV